MRSVWPAASLRSGHPTPHTFRSGRPRSPAVIPSHPSSTRRPPASLTSVHPACVHTVRPSGKAAVLPAPSLAGTLLSAVLCISLDAFRPRPRPGPRSRNQRLCSSNGHAIAGRIACVMWNRGNTTQPILGRFVDMQVLHDKGVRTHLHRNKRTVSRNTVTTVVCHAVLRQGQRQGCAESPRTRHLREPAHPQRLRTRRGRDGPHPCRRRVAARGEGTDAEWAAKWIGHGIRVPQSRLAWETAAKAKAGRRVD